MLRVFRQNDYKKLNNGEVGGYDEELEHVELGISKGFDVQSESDIESLFHFDLSDLDRG